MSCPVVAGRPLGRTARRCQVVDEVGYGPDALVDQGDKINPNSLTGDGSTFSWRSNGEARIRLSAPAGPPANATHAPPA